VRADEASIALCRYVLGLARYTTFPAGSGL